MRRECVAGPAGTGQRRRASISRRTLPECGDAVGDPVVPLGRPSYQDLTIDKITAKPVSTEPHLVRARPGSARDVEHLDGVVGVIDRVLRDPAERAAIFARSAEDGIRTPSIDITTDSPYA